MKGFGLLEIVIAAAVMSASIFSLIFVFSVGGRLEIESGKRIRANFLAEEGLEVLRFLRDKSWSANLSDLSPASTYYLSFASTTSTWLIGTSSPGMIDELFERKITIENVNRNNSDDIALSGGNNDPDTKKFNVEISWLAKKATTTLVLSAYLTNLFNN